MFQLTTNHVLTPQVLVPPRYLFFGPRLVSYLALPARLVFQTSQSIEAQLIILSSQPRLQSKDAVQQPRTPFYTSQRQQQTQKEHTRSSSVSLDPENHLRVYISVKFRATLNQFDYVFNPKVEYGHGAAGPFEAEVNMHSV